MKSSSLHLVFTDLTHLSREKEKKGEAEHGGSKGRKLRRVVTL